MRSCGCQVHVSGGLPVLGERRQSEDSSIFHDELLLFFTDRWSVLSTRFSSLLFCDTFGQGIGRQRYPIGGSSEIYHRLFGAGPPLIVGRKKRENGRTSLDFKLEPSWIVYITCFKIENSFCAESKSSFVKIGALAQKKASE